VAGGRGARPQRDHGSSVDDRSRPPALRWPGPGLKSPLLVGPPEEGPGSPWLLALAGAAGACSSSLPAPRSRSMSEGQPPSIRSHSESSTTVTAPPSTTTTIDPGSLPQTSDEPSAGCR
jgi:hypothetical protein